MENVVDNYTAYGLREARSHPVDHPPRTPELGEGAAGMVLTQIFVIIRDKPCYGRDPYSPEKGFQRGQNFRSIFDSTGVTLQQSNQSRVSKIRR